MEARCFHQKSEGMGGGGRQGGKSWLENCFGDSVGVFWLGIIVSSGQSDTCVMTPQHHENHGVSLKRDMKVKKIKKMPSAERLSREGMRARKQMETLSSLCTVRPWNVLSLPHPQSQLTRASALPRPWMGRFAKHTVSF